MIKSSEYAEWKINGTVLKLVEVIDRKILEHNFTSDTTFYFDFNANTPPKAVEQIGNIYKDMGWNTNISCESNKYIMSLEFPEHFKVQPFIEDRKYKGLPLDPVLFEVQTLMKNLSLSRKMFEEKESKRVVRTYVMEKISTYPNIVINLENNENLLTSLKDTLYQEVYRLENLFISSILKDVTDIPKNNIHSYNDTLVGAINDNFSKLEVKDYFVDRVIASTHSYKHLRSLDSLHFGEASPSDIYDKAIYGYIYAAEVNVLTPKTLYSAYPECYEYDVIYFGVSPKETGYIAGDVDILKFELTDDTLILELFWNLNVSLYTMDCFRRLEITK